MINYVALYDSVMCGDTDALQHLKDLSANNDRNATIYVMLLNRYGTPGSLVPKDTQHADTMLKQLTLSWLETEARDGNNVHAIYALGCHWKCNSNNKGVLFLQRASDMGHAFAMNDLGDCYFHGAGALEINIQHALALHSSAANEGCTDAYINEGMLYDEASKRKLAFAAYQMAADRGSCQGQHNVGVCYHNSFGVSRDEEEGDRWLRLAADQGYPSSVKYFKEEEEKKKEREKEAKEKKEKKEKKDREKREKKEKEKQEKEKKKRDKAATEELVEVEEEKEAMEEVKEEAVREVVKKEEEEEVREGDPEERSS